MTTVIRTVQQQRRRALAALAALLLLAAGFWIAEVRNAPRARANVAGTAAFNAMKVCTATCTFHVLVGDSIVVELWGAGGGGGTSAEPDGGGGGGGGYVRS